MDHEVTTREKAADMLLRAAYAVSPLDVFDKADEFSADIPDSDEWRKLQRVKAGAELLVAARMARFTGEDRSQIEITNAGRYWALSGGYLGFLKDEAPPRAGGSARERNPEFEAMRMSFMKLRLQTFWWSFGLSLAGFAISLLSLGLILFGRDLLLR
jgi:hypothetical protein